MPQGASTARMRQSRSGAVLQGCRLRRSPTPRLLSDFIDSRYAIYAYCRCCPHYTRLDVLALIVAHGAIEYQETAAVQRVRGRGRAIIPHL
jgi:hypothetical protein